MTENGSSMDKLQEAYREKVRRPETWSGLPLEEVYRPSDLEDIEYDRDIADPGAFPYTRGIHANMYRGRYWTKREVCGYGGGAETNERLRFLVSQGAGGLNVITDVPGKMGIDADHPRAEGEIGVSGVNLCTIDEMEALCEGIPLDRVSFSLIEATPASPVILAFYLAVAEKRGIPPEKLAGTIQNDPLHTRYCGFRPGAPLDMSLKLGVDIIEYCTRYMPKWYPTNVNLYDLREHGINAPQEVAFGFSMAQLYIDGTLGRGLAIDDFAPRLAFYCSSHIDFFEEIAKLRAARRLWAKIMKEKYGAKDPRSLQFRFGVHTAGCSLVPQEPLNNVIRVAYQAMAAVLAGVQSLHCCSYDEPIALPTEDSVKLALRTEQILSYETGVANVSDPLGGSWYVESLTNRIEAEAVQIMEEIAKRGGMMAAMRSEWIDGQFEEAALNHQRALERGDKIVVGVNAFTGETQENTPGGVHRVSLEVGRRQAERVRRFKQDRDQEATRQALIQLRERAGRGEKENLMDPIIAAVKAKATIQEIMGQIRLAYGHTYDPMGVVTTPF